MSIEFRLFFGRKGKTERPGTLSALARARGAEAAMAYLCPALVVQGGSHEDRP